MKLQTIKQSITAEYEYNRSKFFGFIYSVKTIDEIEKLCNKLKTQFKDAHQFCYAYRLYETAQDRFNDDTEPLHSAGYVIYQLMLKQAITNALIVIVRYKSGSNLGLSLLKRSYLTCAKQLLNNNLISYQQLVSYNFNVAYNHINSVLYFCHSHFIKVINQTYTMNGVSYEVELSSNMLNNLVTFLKSLK